MALKLAVQRIVVQAALALGLALPAQSQELRPPRATEVDGAIDTVLLSAPFDSMFACVEHAFGELAYAGDALGTDCMVMGGVDGRSGYLRPYRTDGAANADWFGWGEPVRAPADAEVILVHENPAVNTPGEMGPPPASIIRFRTDDGVIISFGHVAEITVKPGDRVSAGDILGKVGNNGVSRSPHIHVGAYRAADAVPLQIRWDLRSLARYRRY